MRDLVRAQHENRADQALDQSHRRRHAPVAADDAAVVDVRVEHFGGLQADLPLLQHDLFEADGEHVAEFEDEQQYDDRPDRRQGDVPELAQPTAAVDGDRLEQFQVDPGDRGEEDDGPPAGVLPDRLRGDQGEEQVRVADDAEQRQVVLTGPVVVDAGVAQHVLEQRDHDHPGHEVRQVEHRLHDAFDPFAEQAVEQQGQRDRDREHHDDLEERDDQCVLQGVEKSRVPVEDHLEVGEPDPG
ncbi:hypothetical protein Jiend_10220 [Micromonospora endophytica]|nr:hypothetical protein Jiend_10220 [Micromonospora endophytica]